MNIDELEEQAYQVRERILRMGASRHGTHVGGSLSIADVLTVLYLHVLKVDPARPDWPQRDRFVLSKGHGSAALYAVLAARGFIEPAECDQYGESGSRLVRQCMPPGRKFADHVPYLRTIERSAGDCAVMRAHAPGRPELRPRGD